MQEKKKKSSFSDSINFMVVLSFGIAFLIIYIASISLLLLTGEPDRSFYIKAIFLFVIFLLIYVGSSFLVIYKIRKMFRPLDKLAHGLLTEEVRIYGDSDDIAHLAESLKQDMRRLEALSQELDDTRFHLDKMQTKAMQDQSSMESNLGRGDKLILELEKSREQLKSDLRKEKLLLNDLTIYAADISRIHHLLNTKSTNLLQPIAEGKKSLSDVCLQNEQCENAYAVLKQMLKEDGEHLESMFSEMMLLQSISARIKLLTSNFSLELARNGIRDSGPAGMLKELEQSAERMNDKSDAMAMLLIRAQNSARQAAEQADFSQAETEKRASDFAVMQEKLKDIPAFAEEFSTLSAQLSANAEHIAEQSVSLKKLLSSKTDRLNDMQVQQTELKKWQTRMQNKLK